jgi:hypothetical protein
VVDLDCVWTVPKANKKILQLGGDVVIDCVEVSGIMQGACIGFAFTSQLVGDCGNDTSLVPRFLELSRAEKVATQDSV